VALDDPTEIAYVVAAVVFAWVAVLTWRRRAHNPVVAVSLVVVMLGLGLSSVADAVAVAATDQRSAAIASLAILPGWVLRLAPSCAWLSESHDRSGRHGEGSSRCCLSSRC
jgi:biotin transporter BioY